MDAIAAAAAAAGRPTASADVSLIHGDRTAIEHWTEIDVFMAAR